MKHRIELEIERTTCEKCIKKVTKVWIDGEHVANIRETWHLLFAGYYEVVVTFPRDTFHTEHHVDSFGEAVGLIINAFEIKFRHEENKQ